MRPRPLPFPADLDPLVATLTAMAQQDASAVRAAATTEARDTETRAGAEARRVLEAARRTGALAAERTAAGRRAEGRREAQELVLAARRGCLDRLRAESVARLSAHLERPEGEELSRYLRAAVARAAGAPDAEQVCTDRGWAVVAATPDGRAELRLEDLVEQVIASFGEEVEALWR